MNRFSGTSLWLSAEAPPETLGSGFDATNFYGSILQVIIALAVIIGIIVLLIRFLAKRNKQWAANRSMRILGGVTLGQNKSMQIVEIGDAVYIVGIGDNITLLDKISEPEAVEELLLSIEGTRSAASAPFSFDLSRWMSQLRAGGAKAEEKEEMDSAVAFKDLLQSRLKNVTNRKDLLRDMAGDAEEQRRDNETP
ncbi:flagellar biosynthetic protein FliO [Paenibacillus thermotolerans]|uniref:flagellar biosynthetic protein FliO n=1 Tax=Paenibacillus thermotolerans TaxID=3027807 RepID=UPI00236830E2|nr:MULTISPECIES: flagellar biosynthetic protein FliO [unclassified Paenibacillus]